MVNSSWSPIKLASGSVDALLRRYSFCNTFADEADASGVKVKEAAKRLMGIGQSTDFQSPRASALVTGFHYLFLQLFNIEQKSKRS
jgi:hypothetical protein